MRATLTALLGLLCLGMMLAAEPAAAQLPNYGNLPGFGQGEEAEPQQSTPLPVVIPDRQPVRQGLGQSTPQGGPTIDDYGVVADSAPDPMLDATRQAVEVFRSRLVSTINRLPEAKADMALALAAASPTGRASYFVGVVVFTGALLVIGRAITMLFYVFVARRLLEGMQRQGTPVGYYGKFPLLAYRVFLTTVGLLISILTATLVGLVFYQEHEATLVTVIVVFTAYVLVTLVDTIWRMAIAPYLPDYRIPSIADAAARSLYRWLSVISAFGVLSMAFVYWMQALGLATAVHTAITVALSLLTVLMLLVMMRVHRRSITGMFLGGKPREEVSWPALAAATLWAPAVGLYLLFTWGDMSFRLIMGIETGATRLAVPYLIFMSGLIVYAGASYLIERLFARTREMAEINAELEAQREAEEAAEAERLMLEIRDQAGQVGETESEIDDGDEGGAKAVENPASVALFAQRRPALATMEDLARRAASLFAIGAVAYALIRFWGGPTVFADYLALDLAQDVVDILFVGYLVYHAVRIWIDGRIRDEVGDEPEDGAIIDGEGGGAGATRLATLLPLLRNFILIVIVTAISLLLLVELGVNVAPLFAGAGIVGLAIGFGSQTLVRDILSGAFFLADDAFRKGEYIDVGEVKGTVEKISLRSFQLRHHLGMLHTIPFGEITHLTNFSRDWVMMKLPLRLTYDTDVEQVRKLVKKLGLRLLEDPEIGDKFIQPVKSQGVIQMDDSAMIVRIKFMTYPGEQWVLRKRIYAEIRELFAAEGIKFAHREVTVRIPGIEDKKEPLSEDEMRAVGAAARRSVDAVEEEMLATGTGGPEDTR